MKSGILIFILLLLSSTAIACKDNYLPNENVLIQDTIEPVGEGADCNITLYKNNTLVINSAMLNSGLSYRYEAGILPEGAYISNLACTLNGTLFSGECDFTVGEENTMVAQVLIAFALLGVFGILLWVAERFEFLFFRINIAKHLSYMAALWLLLPVLNICIVVADAYSFGFLNTITSVYKATMWIFIFITAIYLVGFLHHIYSVWGEKA